jgi:hypothetical protein
MSNEGSARAEALRRTLDVTVSVMRTLLEDPA